MNAERARGGDAFLAVCLNPVLQKTLAFDRLRVDAVNRAVRQRTDASGKGVNVARVLTQSGRRAIHLTHAGGPNRDWFLALCAQDGLDVRWVDSGAEIRVCTTVIDLAEGTATELVEEGLPVAKDTAARLLDAFAAALPGCGAVVVSGTKAAGYPPEVIPEIARRARAAGALLILDIKGADLEACLEFRPTVVKPNLAELLATRPLPRGADLSSGSGPAHEAALRDHATRIAMEWKRDYGTDLIVTRGHRPIWFLEDGRGAEEPVVEVKALNPTGSGDSFTAGLAAALADGKDLRAAIRAGARLGALNAANLKPGSILPD